MRILWPTVRRGRRRGGSGWCRNIGKQEIPVTHGVMTMVDEAEGISHIPPRAAVCVVRAERQGTRMLITLMITADIEEISGERSLHVNDIDGALEAVRHFLVRFRGSPDHGGSSRR